MNKTILSWLGVLVVVVVGVVALVYFADETNGDDSLDAFAQCVTDKGFTMYGTYSCPHCQTEKRAYGSSFQYIKYVECTKEFALCNEKGISGVPTWISGAGERYEGAIGLEGMAKVSGCELP